MDALSIGSSVQDVDIPEVLSTQIALWESRIEKGMAQQRMYATLGFHIATKKSIKKGKLVLPVGVKPKAILEGILAQHPEWELTMVAGQQVVRFRPAAQPAGDDQPAVAGAGRTLGGGGGHLPAAAPAGEDSDGESEMSEDTRRLATLLGREPAANAAARSSWQNEAVELWAPRMARIIAQHGAVKRGRLTTEYNGMVNRNTLQLPAGVTPQSYRRAVWKALIADRRFQFDGRHLSVRNGEPVAATNAAVTPALAHTRARPMPAQAASRSATVPLAGHTVPTQVHATYEQLQGMGQHDDFPVEDMAWTPSAAAGASRPRPHRALGGQADSSEDEDNIPATASAGAMPRPQRAASVSSGATDTDSDDDDDDAQLQHLLMRTAKERHTSSTAAVLRTSGAPDGDVQSKLYNYFFGGSRLSAAALSRGYTLGDATSARSFPEAALLGSEIDGKAAATIHDARPAADAAPRAIYMNTHEPFCMTAVGVQGGGKSHTLACVLESCLVPFPAMGTVRLQTPMSALVLHYDQNAASVCEATGLISPSPVISRILGPAAVGRGTSAPGPAGGPSNGESCLPRERMVVLVSPSYYKQRKEFYGNYCEVRPLLFKWSSLTADHLKRIMRLRDGDNQLYVATMLDMLRRYQREGLVPTFSAFVAAVKKECNIKGQEGPLSQRLRLLESVVAESSTNAGLAGVGADLYDSIKPGMLVVADLTDPLLSSEEANGIFQVLTEQYRALPMTRCGSGKLLALDEAHKFLDATAIATDGLSQAIVNVARLMRHDGMRLVVSTQSPRALAPELLELVTVAVLHRFHSRDWFTYLCQKLPLPVESWGKLMALQPGEALVFASRIARAAVPDLRGTRGSANSGAWMEEGTEANDVSHGHVLHLRIRPRITADRGTTRSNVSSTPL